MNRSILIVICDFLLVNLLVFSTIDMGKVSDPSAQHGLDAGMLTNRVDIDQDKASVMRMALEDEGKRRAVLEQQLTERERQVQSYVGQLTERERQVQNYMGQLTERERQVRSYQQQIETREQEAARLRQERARLESEYSAAQTNLQALSTQLQSTSTDSVLSREKLAAMEAEMRRQTEQAAAMQREMAALARSNQLVMTEKQQLATQLQVAEVERRAASEKAALMQESVKVEREEKARLAENVRALATKSSELAQEVRETRPLASNTIFNDVVTNRVQAHFDAYRPTVFGLDSTRRRDTDTVLVSNGTNVYALCHVQDTPLILWNPGTEWQALTGSLSHRGAQLPVNSLCFSLRDPRILLMPLDAAQVKQLGCKAYRVTSDPFKFQDAVLVGARDGYYGECRFQIDLTTPGYLKLDRNFLKGLFGKFNPSSGDLVFSRTGELLGVMANGSYCMVLDTFHSAAAFQLGNVSEQHTGMTLSQLYSTVAGMPSRLQ
jgi:hypothetical protein